MQPPEGLYTVNYVPESAGKTAKRIGQIFNQLKEESKAGRWDTITPQNFFLEYDTNYGTLDTYIIYVDINQHKHQFRLSYFDDWLEPPLTAANEFGEFVCDNFVLIYLFEGIFDDEAPFVRSFPGYIASCLPEQIKRIEEGILNSRLDIRVGIEAVYDTFCALIDTVVSNIQPIEWFYETESMTNTIYTRHALYEDKKLSKFLRNLIEEQRVPRGIIKTYLRGINIDQIQNYHNHYFSCYGRNRDIEFYKIDFGKWLTPVYFSCYVKGEVKEDIEYHNKEVVSLVQAYLSSHTDIVDMEGFHIRESGFTLYFFEKEAICDKHLRIFCGLLTILLPFLRGETDLYVKNPELKPIIYDELVRLIKKS